MFGSHLSIAGSMTNALREAEALGLDTVQVFTKNQQQWAARPLDPAAVAEWRAEVARLGWQDRTVSHASYLINLASPDDELWRKSIDLMREEIERCETLGIPLLVHHPGAHTTSTLEEGLERIAAAYERLFAQTRGYRTVSCLENTAGGGSTIGRTFEELATLRARIAERTGEPGRIGFCLDTCHAHAGGYDMAARAAADRALDEFDALCGLGHLRMVHVNDSAAAMGSRRDRHAHIGEGTIGAGAKSLGRTGFAAVVNRPGLASVPKILETPKGQSPSGEAWDALNLGRLRRLVKVSRVASEPSQAGDVGARSPRAARKPAAARASARPR